MRAYLLLLYTQLLIVIFYVGISIYLLTTDIREIQNSNNIYQSYISILCNIFLHILLLLFFFQTWHKFFFPSNSSKFVVTTKKLFSVHSVSKKCQHSSTVLRHVFHSRQLEILKSFGWSSLLISVLCNQGY